jgi:hypothetical protein
MMLRSIETSDWVTFAVYGSWLNMTELEFDRLQQRCLDRRGPDAATLRREVTAWANALNSGDSDID